MGEAAADTTTTSKAKSDEGGGGTTLDKVLSKLDSIHQRMDAIEAKADAAVADARKRKDEWPDKDEDKDKADARKRTTVRVGDDGDLTLQHEGSEKPKEPVQGGEPPPMLPGKGKNEEDKDDSKSKSKKADEWPDKDKDKDDSRRGGKRADRDKDEDTTVGNVTKGDEGKGEDDQEKEIAKGDARADAIIRKMADRIAKLESRDTMADDDLAQYADAQARADEVAQLFGKQAKRWLTGESLPAYRRRLATDFRVHSPQWKDVKLSDLPDNAFVNIEKAIYADAAAAAVSPSDLAEGEFRKVTKTDPDTGLKQIHWFGNHSFIKDLGRPGRRVVGFRNRNMA
jgi:hypothetical protein